eukprot:gb/GECG01002733.1/.p1 GENE.gb/GECG01002733.1/~~gb/GECG01002733.1/.p1  ORF type:complete len:122 (+),score=15.04 gb/GECG01002733.1/:1-366(+)
MTELRSDDSSFLSEEVDEIVRSVIETHLLHQHYDENKISEWTSRICEDTIQALASLKKPFKYNVTCLIAQNTGGGLCSAHSSYCDGVNDGVQVVKWPSDKQKDQSALNCTVTVFGSALFVR